MKIKTSQLYKLIIYFFITWDTILLSVFNFNPGVKDTLLWCYLL